MYMTKKLSPCIGTEITTPLGIKVTLRTSLKVAEDRITKSNLKN